MKAAVLEMPTANGPFDADRLREIILVRLASAPHGLTRAELAEDLAPLVAHRTGAAQWSAAVDQQLAALAARNMVASAAGRMTATDAGAARAAAFLGLRGKLTRPWNELRDVRLVAKALGLHREPAKRLQELASADGLRAAIVQRAYRLRMKGHATPSRLRSALAALALERAFGNKLTAGIAGKSGLSPKAGRLLAAQLCRKPRDFGTDARLIAALAADHVGTTQGSVDALRLALLRRFVDGDGEKGPAPGAPERVASPPRPRLVEAAPAPAPGRPDLAGFAHEVGRHATAQAQGWVGNRKAFISHVWRRLREQRPEWGLSEIEFKCMLTEAHRAGRLALANADLKEASSMQDLKDSAVVYKNAVFHFIRVDG